MHLVPVAPGLRLLAVNSAVLLSSSESATVPAVQLLVGLTVVAENAEYDAAHTMPPEASRATGAAAAATRRFLLIWRRDMGCFLHVGRPVAMFGPVDESLTDANTDKQIKPVNRDLSSEMGLDQWVVHL